MDTIRLRKHFHRYVDKLSTLRMFDLQQYIVTVDHSCLLIRVHVLYVVENGNNIQPSSLILSFPIKAYHTEVWYAAKYILSSYIKNDSQSTNVDVTINKVCQTMFILGHEGNGEASVQDNLGFYHVTSISS